MTDIANRDANRVPSLLARDYSNSANEVAVTADPATGRLLTQTTGSVSVPGVATSDNQDTQTAILNLIETNTEALGQLGVVIKTMLQAVTNPPYIDKSANAIRNQVQSGTVTTVTTVTNLTNFGTQAADVTYRINSSTAWANNVRQIIV